MIQYGKLGIASAIAAGVLSLSGTGSLPPATAIEPITAPSATPAPLIPLGEWPASLTVTDDRLADWQPTDRAPLLTAIEFSLQYLDTPAALEAYASYPIEGITRDRVRQSLLRFRTLLLTSESAATFQSAVQQEFVAYQAAGYDGVGTVHFTAYFEPSFQASRVPTEDYRYPLYRRPPTLETWPEPHPTRRALEGVDGLQGHQGPLQGLELVWLKDRLEAFLVQVQGSAKLQLTSGGFMSVGYAGRTEYEYTSIGRELINDGKIPASELTLDRLLDHFQAYPEELDVYLPRNDRFVFFRETSGGPPTGTFSVPVTAERSIATDKSLMPPGALALMMLDWPEQHAAATWQSRPISRYVLNQDTGGAIQGAGRVDVFVGTGDEAGAQAGQVNTDGRVFYLLLRPRE
ncbi:MAG: MltA domain-containing protein [Cyanobacteria bacterium J06638_28]